MLGVAFAYLSAQVGAFIKRQAVVYAIITAAALIAVFAAGYSLDALHELLARRIGQVYASLILAGGLLGGSFLCIVISTVVGRARPSAKNNREASPRLSYSTWRPTWTGAAAIASGAVTGLVAGILAAKPPWRGKTADDPFDGDRPRSR